MKVTWHHARAHRYKDPERGIARTWFGTSPCGTFEIFQGWITGTPPDPNPLGLKIVWSRRDTRQTQYFVYMLRKPDGTSEDFRVVTDAKRAAHLYLAQEALNARTDQGRTSVDSR